MTAVPGLDAAQATLELVVDARAELGEGPLWDPRIGVLWWVDILAGAIHRHEPATGRDETLRVGGLVGAVVLRARGGLVAALEDRVVALDPDTVESETLVAFPAQPGLRSNDAAVDPAGRLWVDRIGRKAEPAIGSLVRVDPNGTLAPGPNGLTGLTIPNGLDWSADGRTMYYVDSTWREVRAFDYDLATGSMGEGRTLLRLPGEGLPDGLTVDDEGCVWVAQWGSSRVLRASPDGEVLGEIRLPVSQVSSCAFGGDDLGDLYITTAWEDFGPTDRQREPLAGGLWRCRPGVRGRPPTPFAG